MSQQVRKSKRFYIKDSDNFIVQLETNPGKTVNCFLNDISANGACIILDKTVFVQREKQYPFVFLKKKEDGSLEKFATATGKMAWYLTKEFRNEDMMYLGIEFSNEINLPPYITN
ncbi:MAG TPA: PilZ domain-containing protein [Leptospiraceae bacterium]|nr:PilZ domain-containing protein [Leptospiraceae bacterium]HMW07583.1 PilZ domain-containing protein [Leptospiraceae bacterium]HMX33039.1 PilZ domain-containing protein [Leptospiraceae bacterium]HMY33202.1 PilZ domain-containing protein [Leptospiraceae bacterium]HMZ65072.1 PilZ domain-containing protein [Leptospiraceae bacterium]